MSAPAQHITFLPHEFVTKSYVGSDPDWVIQEADEGEWVLLRAGQLVHKGTSFAECAREARTLAGWKW